MLPEVSLHLFFEYCFQKCSPEDLKFRLNRYFIRHLSQYRCPGGESDIRLASRKSASPGQI